MMIYFRPYRKICTGIAAALSWVAAATAGTYQLARVNELIGANQLDGGNFLFIASSKLNDSGKIVGAYISEGRPTSRLFQYSDANGLDDLGSIGGGLDSLSSYDINNKGELAVSGFRSSTGLFEAARMETSGNLTFTGTLAGFDGRSSGINASGTVIGHYQIDDDENERAFTFDAEGNLTNLGTLGGSSSRALGINDLGHVVGRSRVTFDVNSGSPSSPFVWTPENGMEIITDLPGVRPQGNARDINESGWIVGDIRGAAFIRTAEGLFVENVGDFIFTTPGGNQFNITTSSSALKMLENDFAAFGNSTVNDGSVRIEPWRWTEAGGTEFFDEFEIEGFLDDDWDFFEFEDANEPGQILALAKYTPTGENFTVLLTPVTIPEPAAGITLLMAGWIFLAQRRRKTDRTTAQIQ
jgi:probable HAF family extracellular repeat protein